MNREDCARALFREMKRSELGVTALALRRATGASDGTFRRARAWLEARGVPLYYDAALRTWRLRDPSYDDAALDPKPADAGVVLLGAALVQPFLDAATRARVDGAVAAIGRALGDDSPRRAPSVPRVLHTMTMRTTVDPGLLRRVLDTMQSGVLRITYYSPWANHRERHVIEPWQCLLSDGVVYLRAWSRTRGRARTFHLGFVESSVSLSRDSPRQSLPAPEELWGRADTEYGVDEHEPGLARVVFRGPVARWLARIEWTPSQTDVVRERGDVLERSVPYRSRREFARRLLSFCDAIESIDPPELREEVMNAVEALRWAIAKPKIDRGR